MHDKTKSEALAKAAIYVIFTLVLLAFVMFLMGARSYAAVRAESPSSQSEAAPQSGQDESFSQPEESLPQKSGAAAAPAVQGGDEAKPEAEPETTPGAEAEPEAEPEATPKAEPESEPEAEPETEPEPDPLEEELLRARNQAAEAIRVVDADQDYGEREMLIQTKPLNQEALAAEVARINAMGFGVTAPSTPEYMGAFHATAYCCEVYPHICGGNGVTASGTVPTPGLTAAADWRVLPPGTWLYIEGVGIRRVEDSGSAIKSARLDIAIDTHDNALRWGGFGRHDVWVLAWPS